MALARGPSSLPPLPVSRIEDHDALKDVDQLLDEVDYSIEEDIEEPIQSATDAHQAYTLEGREEDTLQLHVSKCYMRRITKDYHIC